MADLTALRAHESLATDTAAHWKVSTRLDISDGAAAEKQLSKDTYSITVYSDSDVVFRFDVATGDSTSATNDLIIPANTLIPIRVPIGLLRPTDGKAKLKRDTTDIYFHVKQVSATATSYLRLVEH